MDMRGAGSDEPDWSFLEPQMEPAEETEPAIAMDPASALCAPVVAAAGGTGDQEETFQDMEAKQLQLRVAELEREAEMIRMLEHPEASPGFGIKQGEEGKITNSPVGNNVPPTKKMSPVGKRPGGGKKPQVRNTTSKASDRYFPRHMASGPSLV